MKIDWFITRICNQASFCRFCYAPWNFFPPDVSTERALKICEQLAQLGADTVTICGGEPFMYPGLDRVVRKLHALAIKVVLYTSATSDQHDLHSLLPYVDFLSLPVDAVSAVAVQKMRGQSQFSRVSGVLASLSRVPNRPKVKVGTVVTRQNIDDLNLIGDFLRESGTVDVWRLYEFSPYGIGKHNEKRYLLAPAEFEQAVVKAKLRNETCTTHHLAIAERSREDNKGYCLIIDSAGSFYRYAERYIPLGVTIYDSLDRIVAQYDQELHHRQKAWHEG